jgi:hypothetical protein
MMSGLVGFITFPQGYKCTIFATFKEKPSKQNPAIGGNDVNWDEGK